MHAWIAVVALHVGVGQGRGFCPHFHVPDGGHVSVLLRVGYGDAHILCLHGSLVNHRRTLHGVVSAVCIHRPVLPVKGCLHLVLIEEGGIFELSPHLVELHGFAKVYLKPFFMLRAGLLAVPVTLFRLPQRGIVVIHSILGLEPIVVVGRGGHLGSRCQVLVFRCRLEDVHILSVVCRHNRDDVALCVELQFVDAHLTVEAVDGLRVVVAMIDNIVLAANVDDGVVSGAMHSLILVRGQDFALIFEWSHRSHFRYGILHAIRVCVATA